MTRLPYPACSSASDRLALEQICESRGPRRVRWVRSRRTRLALECDSALEPSNSEIWVCGRAYRQRRPGTGKAVFIEVHLALAGVSSFTGGLRR